MRLEKLLRKLEKRNPFLHSGEPLTKRGREMAGVWACIEYNIRLIYAAEQGSDAEVQAAREWLLNWRNSVSSKNPSDVVLSACVGVLLDATAPGKELE